MQHKDLFRTRLRDLQTKDQANRSAQWPKNADSRNSLLDLDTHSKFEGKKSPFIFKEKVIVSERRLS